MKHVALLTIVGLCLVQGLSVPAGSQAPTQPAELVVGLLPPIDGIAPQNDRAGSRSRNSDCRPIARSVRDRPDLRKQHLVHVIYLVPADGIDESLDSLGTLACSVEAQNRWFEEASDGLRWRFDMFRPKAGRGSSTEVADVTFMRSRQPASALGNATAVEGELRSLGFDEPNKRYLTYVAAGSAACGDAAYPIAFSPGAVVDGKYAQVYLKSDEACGAEDFGTLSKPGLSEAIAQQELIHNDGLTSPGAPHGCAGGVPPGIAHVCTGPLFLTEGNGELDPERVDVMYPYVSVRLFEKVLDLGNDDYFNHRFPHLGDLASSPYLEVVTTVRQR